MFLAEDRRRSPSLAAQTKASACNAGDPGSVPGSTRSPGEGIGYPLQYPCLENPMDRGAWRAHKESDTTERLTHRRKRVQVVLLKAGDGIPVPVLLHSPWYR